MWPGSPSRNRDDRDCPSPGDFTETPLLITEKLDGTSVQLHQGRVLTRSADASAFPEPWLALARKHHAWKTAAAQYADLLIYAEDIFAVHAVQYDALREDETTMVFATASLETGQFHPWEETQAICRDLGIKTVPILFSGTIPTQENLQQMLTGMHAEPSHHGPEREGMVIRRRGAYSHLDLHRYVCKTVRAGHVQDEIHWKGNWRPCALTERKRRPH